MTFVAFGVSISGDVAFIGERMKELLVKSSTGGCRRPKNRAEAQFYDACLDHNISITRKGWPDYACVKQGKFFVVEVKPCRSRRLKKHQMTILRILAAYGIRAYRWSPDSGFEVIRIKNAQERDRYGLGYLPAISPF